MLDNEPTGGSELGATPTTDSADVAETTVRRTRAPRKRAAKAAAPVAEAPSEAPAEVAEPVAEKPTRRRARKAAVVPEPEILDEMVDEPALLEPVEEVEIDEEEPEVPEVLVEEKPARRRRAAAATVLFMPPEPTAPAPVVPAMTSPFAQPFAPAVAPFEVPVARVVPEQVSIAPFEVEDEPFEAEPVEPGRRRRSRRGAAAIEEIADADLSEIVEEIVEESEASADDEFGELDADGRRIRRRRGRRGRGRGKGGFEDEEFEDTPGAEAEPEDEPVAEADAVESDEEDEGDGSIRRRRRSRRRRGAAGDAEASDDPNVVVRIREPRKASDEVQGVSGSTRLEAKRQRRRDGREQRRTRPPILTEAEFLARREAVDRVMVVRQKGGRTQTAVLEDGVLVEHYVAQQSASTMVGNVYLGKVQNVLPSMEAAFVDIGRGRNAVLYAGEVNWQDAGLSGRGRSIESALRPGDSVLVQVTKEPVGHKGARLTSHIALSGRHLVYVPHGNASGISRKLSDTERKRLRDILKGLVPDEAGVIVRTAAEGATAEELERDVTRLQAQWETIQARAKTGSAPTALYEEPDLVIRVVRDLFNEDFRELIIAGEDAWEQVEPYLDHVSPDLVARLRRHTGPGDVFAELRIDEQIMKALDRKVFLPSGGSLVIDRTEAMTVVDVNTGKFIGSGGNLEETVTKNNLEAAEEIVRQLRLRDIGGIIVIDFIDMVLESNRDLVLRRLTECLGRDRTKHQVAEITSLGLVQMTRKRMGQGLLEAFSETCDHCKGRGVMLHTEPVEASPASNSNPSNHSAQAAAPAQEPAERKPKKSRSKRKTEEPAAEAPADDAPRVEVSASALDPDSVLVGDEPAETEEGGRRRGRRGGSSRRRSKATVGE